MVSCARRFANCFEGCKNLKRIEMSDNIIGEGRGTKAPISPF